MTLGKLSRTLLALSALGVSILPCSYAIRIEMGKFEAGSSGNFRAKPLDDFASVLDNYASGSSTDGTWFGTFCIEINEGFRSGKVYDVGLNNGSIAGGKSGAVNGKDVISVGTAWLYEQFATGSLADHGFAYGNRQHAKQLQNTIWYLEGEVNYGLGSSKYGSYLNLAMNVDNYAADYLGKSVQVMNLTRKNGRKLHQDQLVYVGGSVPDGGVTALLLLFGLAGLWVAKRKLG